MICHRHVAEYHLVRASVNQAPLSVSRIFFMYQIELYCIKHPNCALLLATLLAKYLPRTKLTMHNLNRLRQTRWSRSFP